MQVIFSKKFLYSLGRIVNFIAQDSPQRARKFRQDVLNKISSLVFMPYRCRKNQLLNDENIRDEIFKGYVIVFAIKENEIEILEIYKENLPNL